MHTIRYAFLGLLLAACSNNNPANDGGTNDGGGNDVNTANTFSQTGQIVDFTSKAGLAGMSVSGGGNTVTTDSTGKYTLPVPKSTAYSMQIASGPSATTAYLTLNEQEWQLTGDVDRGKTSAVSNSTENLLKAILVPQPDPTLSVLTVQVIASGACPSATGATISVPGLPAADAGADASAAAAIHLDYFVGGFPSQSATSATDGEVPSAIIWGLPPTATFNSVTVTPPAGCTVKAFPTSDPTDAGPGANLVYTGNVKLQPSTDDAGTSIASFMRVFLQ
jgi:hypothetical protein